MQLMPVILGIIPGLFLGVRVLLALDVNVAEIIAGLVVMGVGDVMLLAPKLQFQSRLVLPTGITFGFFGGILGAIAAMPGPLVFIFLLAKGLRGKAFTKEASLYLVVSAGLLAILLTASRQFNWLDVLVSTTAMLPVVIGMYVGQHIRDKIAPETFEKLGVDRGHCRRCRVAATWFLQLTGSSGKSAAGTTLGYCCTAAKSRSKATIRVSLGCATSRPANRPAKEEAAVRPRPNYRVRASC